MKLQSTLLALAVLCSSGSVAIAEVQHSEKSEEQQNTQIDANSGAVTQQKKIEQERTTEQSDGRVARAEKERASAHTSKDATGREHENVKKDRSTAEVEAHPDGDVSVEQKREHTEQHQSR